MTIYKWEDIGLECYVEYKDGVVDFKMYEVTYSKDLSGVFTTPEYELKQTEAKFDRDDVGGTVNNTKDIKLAQKFIKGIIKWDGCSHVYFGDEGYIHICGGYNWRNFIEANKRIFNLAKEYFQEPNQVDEFNNFNKPIK